MAPVPPVAGVTEAAPFAPPLHDTFVDEEKTRPANAEGCVIVTGKDLVQPFASVAVTV